MIEGSKPLSEPRIPSEAAQVSAEAAFLQGGGEMGERIRSYDWSKTPLEPAEAWSPTLRMMTSFLLANRFPLLLWWGPQYISIYNDAYRPVLGTKHPWALGQPVSECWHEIWHILQPLIDTPFRGGPATWNDDICLEINRHGFVEETHFTIAYSPVPDETVPSGIGGVLATVHEITGKVVGDRRVQVLRDLGTSSAKAKTAEEAYAIAAATLAPHTKDIPFALLYLIEPDRKTARLAGTAGVAIGDRSGAPSLALEGDEAGDSPWPLVEAMQSEAVKTVPDLAFRLKGQIPSGPWTDPPHTAVVVPIPSNKAHYLAGFLVAGVSPRLRFDEPYRDFFTLVSTQLAATIANAREYEEEKKRAEALAEIDRAKTAFFSNVSHEFRTPLTLMLGPIEELLSRSQAELPPAAKSQLEMAHRNSLRLLRLVNTLLDFSRLEAGRRQAVFEPTDLGALTQELASVFRAATERAGLGLTVDCASLGEPVYVDREMWDKIVLNLVSNAFKFTFAGEIAVTLRAVDGAAELRVRDTGVGIPDEEIPRLFERFYRAPNRQARTHEGSGIGLALVQELARLHGGAVRVESRSGQGSTFIVTVPLGKAHLPPDHVGGAHTLVSTSVGAAPFVEEAVRWLPEDAPLEDGEPLPGEERPKASYRAGEPDVSSPRLLVADDNADMRQYLGRILSTRYQVQAVPDGHAALGAARDCRPDLILSDIMMPGLDGIGLLRELRADATLRTIPVILLSARAGESRVEGWEQGADGYLIKPFSARELMARVTAHLDLARLRKQSEERLQQAQKMESIGFLAGGIAHDFNNLLIGVIGNGSLVQEMLPPDDPACKLVEDILRAGDQLAHLTQQMLAYSGKGQFLVEVVDLSTLVRNISDLVRPSIPSKVALQFDLEEDLPRIEADRGQIQQVLTNLVINAAEAISSHAGSITVSTGAEIVDAGYIRMHPEAADLPPGEYVALQVRDTGCGMDESVKARVFDPFFSTKFAGRGLGLAAVHGIVRGHKGAIFVESEPSTGSTFTVLLPATERQTKRSQRTPTEAAKGSGVVLVIDDEKVVRTTAKKALEHHGYSVLVAYDGLAAINLLRKHPDDIDVVLLDLSMPGMSGEETLPELRKIRPDVKVLVSSGYSEDEAMAMFRGQQVSGFIQKPYTAVVLAEKIKSTIGAAAQPPGKDKSLRR
jgi:signal transduction histidine kinase